MTFSFPRLSIAWLLSLLAVAPLAGGEPGGDGLFARFQTSMGTFWCQLEFERAPRTVANFVGLAEGTRDWIDFKSGRVIAKGFYDGLTFHRVINNFMIQSGSPNGLGTDGPGFRFADEFHPELRHDRAGILSMANSGPNSNGSQFFVTVTNTPWLDDIHSVFGVVVEGLDVVHAISQVPRDLQTDRPEVPVVIEAVTVLRRGSAAEQFLPGGVSPPLPGVGIEPTAMERKDGQLLLVMEPRSRRFLHIFSAAALGPWTYRGWATSQVAAINVDQIIRAPYRSVPQSFLRALYGGTEP